MLLRGILQPKSGRLPTSELQPPRQRHQADETGADEMHPSQEHPKSSNLATEDAWHPTYGNSIKSVAELSPLGQSAESCISTIVTSRRKSKNQLGFSLPH
jgi:hypothetical protein